MGLLNFTTEIPHEKSIGEIFSILSRNGAQAVMTEMDGTGMVEAISFRLPTSFGPTMYKLPVNVNGVLLVLNKQTKLPGKEKIAGKYFNNLGQARRVAWRIIKDWIEAQCALALTGQASMEQIMLPYAVDKNGATLYQRMIQQGSFALPERRYGPDEINVTDT